LRKQWYIITPQACISSTCFARCISSARKGCISSQLTEIFGDEYGVCWSQAAKLGSTIR